MDDLRLRDRIRNTLREEMRKLRSLSWKDRLVYVWDYYKLQMVIVIAVIAVINIAVTIYKNSQIDTLISIYMVNCNSYDVDADELTSDFTDYIGGIGQKEEIELDTTIILDDEDTSNYGMAYQMKFSAVISGQMADVILMDADKYEEYAGWGYFEDLRDVLSEEQLEKWEDRLICLENSEGDSVPCALDLTDAAVVEKSGLYSDTVYGGIVYGSEHLELSLTFFEWMLGE
ncbi:MAG: hypothetical protein LIO94_09125 [Clostridiales bacterium]|nr:hypothetical protein [Clostridiales bacterium]